MDLEKRLRKLRASTIQIISNAASEEEVDQILGQGERLARIEQLLNRYNGLLKAVDALESGESPDPREEPTRRPLPESEQDQMSGRELGKMRRSELVNSDSVALRPFSGVIYESKTGSRVGLPFATERNPGRWFLGLPSGGFDEAILLLETEDGCVHICLPKSFFAQYGTRLSRSGGQVKFNVARRDGGFELIVPGESNVQAKPFVEAFELIGTDS